MYRFICLSLALFSLASLWGYPPLPEPVSIQEELWIRRILDLWRDREFSLAEMQIKKSLEENPQGPYANHFWALLGDLALQSGEFTQALNCYNRLTSETFQEHARAKKWQALYRLEEYALLHEEIKRGKEPCTQLDEEGRFYWAESLLRGALKNEGGGKEQCLEALPIYLSLIGSERFACHARLGLAETYRLLGMEKESALLYMEIAQYEEREEVLFHAASVCFLYDKERSGQIFKQIASRGGHYASEAALQWFLRLADSKDWGSLMKERDFFIPLLDPAKLPLCYFYLGILCYETGLYAQAFADLQNALHPSLTLQQKKRALWALLTCAAELKDWERAEGFCDELRERFPDCAGQACCMLALAHQKKGEPLKALKLYETALQDAPNTPLAEKASLEKIRVLAALQRYAEGHEALLKMMETLPGLVKNKEAHTLAIELTLKELKEKELYGQLAQDLERSVHAAIFSPEEEREKSLLLAQAYLKLGRTVDALILLEGMEKVDPLLMAFCYSADGGAVRQVILYGERALAEISHTHPQTHKLHLLLFNAYLELSKEEEDKNESSQKAAEHLAAIVDALPLSLENRLWLAHHFAKEEPKRALPLLLSLIEGEKNLKTFDREGLLLASLYQDGGQWEEAEALLKAIIALHQKTESLAQLKLAELSGLRGEIEIATHLYENVLHSQDQELGCAARLALARLGFTSHPEKSLKVMQDLATCRILCQEPIHLEAALDYAEYRVSLMGKKGRSAKLLELFLEIKESFTRQDTIAAQDYHASRSVFSDKDLIYQAYMRYLDARILMLQAQLTRDAKERGAKINAAKALLSTVRKGRHAVSSYLKQRAALHYET